MVTRMRDTCGDPAGPLRARITAQSGSAAVEAGAFQEAEHAALSLETRRSTPEKHHVLSKATSGLCLGVASCEKAAVSGPRETP